MIDGGDDGIFQGVGKWPVADIVQQNGNSCCFRFSIGDFIALTAQDVHRFPQQVHGADGVLEPGVICPRVNQVAQPQLLNAAQPLKPRMFDDIVNNLMRNGNKAVNWIVKNFSLIQTGNFDNFLLPLAAKINQIMSNIKILWADDEIELLKPQILFLEEKGYGVLPVSNGQDAIDMCNDPDVNLIFLDEMMPGISGLETLQQIKQKRPTVPVVMITKNETENLMEDAIGSQISDYLIKPVKPQQILLTIKKLTDNKRLVSEKTDSIYQKEFQNIFFSLQENPDFQQWYEIYKKLVYWELQLDQSGASGMKDVFNAQKTEANVEFGKFIDKKYLGWISGKEKNKPVMSHTLFDEKVFPALKEGIPTFFILIDNLRLDQFKTIEPLISESFRLVQEDYFFSILPTATQYSRNAIFAGLLPSEIEKRMPNMWLNDDEEGSKNMYEEEFLKDNITRNRKNLKFSYRKILNHAEGKDFEENILNLMHNDLNVVVYNFVDMLSHARTEMEVLKELASDETAYRSLTRSWFDHSPLYDALRKLAGKKVQIIITTDHGTIRVNTPSKVIADRNTTTNLRYKSGKNLQYNKKEVMEIKNPAEAGLPKMYLSSSFIFGKGDVFLAYPNNYNYYVNYFKNTFQHGGISLEEMIIPFAVYTNY